MRSLRFNRLPILGFLREGGSIKSQERILCKYKIGVVSMKIIIGRCYVKFLKDYYVQKINFFGLFCFSVGRRVKVN